MRSLVRLIRPHQWSKNLLVFAGLIFSGAYRDMHLLSFAVMAFFGMSFVSSSVYVANDLIDRERDRKHPKKRNRPLASGIVSVPAGIGLATVLILAGSTLILMLGKASTLIVALYLLIQVLYNWRLKRIPIADVYCIATGFVLRAALGAAAIGVAISGWLLFCTGALALMLGFGKRRSEFVLQGADRGASRESLLGYNRPVLDALVVMFATGAALCYGVYALESPTSQDYPAIILTAPFVFYGITRYALLIFTIDEGGEPADILFKDRHLLFSIVGFLIAALLAMGGLHLPLLEK